jgi:inner membrane protein
LDSLTQLTVGAAYGEVVLGHKVGRKAMFWGAFLGTLPDLDILIPLGGPVDDFVYHRGFSHSLFLLGLLSPLLAWFITKVHPATRKHFKRWCLLTFLVLETGVLLDLLTVYGTQILWPLDTTPLAWPIFFIIDPLFTLPILLGALAALLLKRSSSLGHRLNMIGLVLSMVYLIWAFGVREFVGERVRDKLAHQHVLYNDLLSTPAPFTTFLWRIVGIDKGQYFETYFSLFDGHTPLFINHYPRNLELIRGLEKHPPVVKLRWFTRGYYAFKRVEKHIVMIDLRMGLEPDYVFQFKVGKVSNPNHIPVKDERLKARQDLRRLNWIWKRIWNPIPHLE